MILRYINKKEWSLVAVCFVLICLQVYLELEIPGYMSEITTLLNTGGTVAQVMDEGWPMIACAFGSLSAAVVVGAVATYIAASIAKRLRKMQFDSVGTFSKEEIGRFSPASLITRSTNDITQVQMAFAMGMQVLIRAPVMAVWAIIKISDKDMSWTSATAVAVMVMMTTIGILMVLVVPRFRIIQRLTDNVNRVTGEGLSGARVIRAYNAEEYQEEKFEQANDDLTSTNLFVNRSMAVLFPVMTAIMSLLSLSIYIIGAILISAAAGIGERLALFSDMIVFSSYAMQVVMAFMMMVIVFMILPRAIVAARRIEEVIDTEPSIKDGTKTSSPAGREGEIEFRNVSFRYPGAAESVLEDLNFKVDKGETIAFIGPTGCGKSTLVNLVMRFYDVTGGQVLVDGEDVRDYKLSTLRGKIGYVPQKATLFSGTVSGNVNYGDTSGERTPEDVRKAVAIAQGTDFVERMEDGYEGRIAEGGTNLSGGQKQRLSIARAICRRPEFYIFDDSFSALDYKTDRLLREALGKETAGVTNLIVTQRIGTIMDADTIVVLDKGRIVGIGTHGDLMKSSEVYREIAYSQLSEEELIA
ncbi:MAG: ABC transporter ATP-binding protein [Euryarchaeota archaeon]|nr:ABC transporter ATP-binding protein [Euryarchaeota archaeon]